MKVKHQSDDVLVVVCLGCGCSGSGVSLEDAWKDVVHGGRSHAAESMDAEQAIRSKMLQIM